MNTKPTVATLKRIVKDAGGTVEEDTGARGMRTFQVCSPEGSYWVSSGSYHLVLYWDSTPSNRRDAWNMDVLRDLKERLRCGLRPADDE